MTEINAALATKQASKHMKVVAANFNSQGNLIISTRSDQTAAELLKFHEALTPVIARIGNGQEFILREDKKWFKIQIDAVNTYSVSIGNGRIINQADAVHSELLSCNPQYANILSSIVAKPRWLHSNEELLTTPRSSLVFATTNKTAARHILKHKTLAAFSRHCPVRAFQDRPPILQCRNCWRFDHNSHQCKESQ